MPRIADYVTIRDASFDLVGLSQSILRNLPFTVNSDAVLNRADSRPVLCYKVRPLQNEPVTLLIEINGTQVESITNLSVDTVVGLWEIIPGNLLNAGPSASNTVRFNKHTGANLRISDVILWYQRNIA